MEASLAFLLYYLRRVTSLELDVNQTSPLLRLLLLPLRLIKVVLFRAQDVKTSRLGAASIPNSISFWQRKSPICLGTI